VSPRAAGLAVLWLAFPRAVLAAVTPGEAAVTQAEALAAEAIALSTSQPKEAVLRARRALATTVQFDPMAFVVAGRKGEVVEDEFQAARTEYRRHRAKLYGAMGETLAAAGDPAASARYLRRAALLDPTAPRYVSLARSLLGLGRGPEALSALEKTVGLGGFPADAVPLVAQAVDAAGWPSAQVEIDRARFKAAALANAEWRDGPLILPDKTRLSTSPFFRLDESPVNILYAAETSCRTCSEDVEGLRRVLRPGMRVLAVPEVDGQDHALRQVLGLYRVDWPVLLAPSLAKSLKLPPRSILVSSRGGWALVLVKPPFQPAVGSVLGIFTQNDVAETVPRAGWNRRPVDRHAAVAEPAGLLPEGLAPSEEVPSPPEMDAALAAFRAGRNAEALRLFEALEAKGDGQLLTPEARLNRALCLAALGQRETARLLLLRTGDSRFQEAVDRALEKVGSPPRRPK
jgi:tetratricopeptide (TPR) repeat protein